MRKIPAAPTQRLDIAMARMLQENQELQPQMLLLFEQSALMQREKHLAFVRAGLPTTRHLFWQPSKGHT
jgi:hypothetical protein